MNFRAALVAVSMAAQTPPLSPNRNHSHIAIAQDLPGMNGKHLRSTLVEVTYAPGQASPSHTHPCPVIGYVLEGAIRFQVNEGPERVLHAGETFYEAPGSIHRVSANASQTAAARFLAYFVCDGNPKLTIPAAAAQERSASR